MGEKVCAVCGTTFESEADWEECCSRACLLDYPTAQAALAVIREIDPTCEDAGAALRVMRGLESHVDGDEPGVKLRRRSPT